MSTVLSSLLWVFIFAVKIFEITFSFVLKLFSIFLVILCEYRRLSCPLSISFVLYIFPPHYILVSIIILLSHYIQQSIVKSVFTLYVILLILLTNFVKTFLWHLQIVIYTHICRLYTDVFRLLYINTVSNLKIPKQDFNEISMKYTNKVFWVCNSKLSYWR